ncbi:hypothetical protein B4168_3596 [Anoxybacillus flavithermus]|nr:hypothetical protein B4168_3596 [Anoxybacillus flavithermus]
MPITASAIFIFFPAFTRAWGVSFPFHLYHSFLCLYSIKKVENRIRKNKKFSSFFYISFMFRQKPPLKANE